MTLPRNKLYLNLYNHKKNGTRIITQQTNILENVFRKHNIGKLTFRSCKFASKEGAVTHIEYEEIKGNLRSSIIVVKAKTLTKKDEPIYDLVKLEQEIQEKEIKKQKEAQKMIDEMSEKMSLQKDNNSTQKSCSSNKQDFTKTDNMKESIQKDSGIINKSSMSNDGRNETLRKRDKYIKQLNDQLKKKVDPKTKRNKYYRKFMRELKSKFSIELQNEFKFFEVLAGTSEMVITNAEVYKIEMIPGSKWIYFLIVGDLQLKSSVLRQIDPCYNFDKVFQEQTEFLERIKSNEKNKSEN
ncbi:MAG: hypothetical protein QXW79_00210 [Thermoplasmata archaeon]